MMKAMRNVYLESSRDTQYWQLQSIKLDRNKPLQIVYKPLQVIEGIQEASLDIEYTSPHAIEV